MDAELRALIRRIAADPDDHAAGLALARELVRRRGEATASALAPGSAVLVVGASSPRRGFAWRPFMERAIGRVGHLGEPAKDGLTFEVTVPGVGRFHAGRASLFALPGPAPRDLPPEPAPRPRRGRSIADLRRLAREVADDLPLDPGEPGPSPALRALFQAIPESEGAELADVAERAGFVRENNRDLETAAAVLFGAAPINPRVRTPLVTLELPVLLGGVAVPGPLDTGAWGLGDLWVARVPRASEVLDALPWALLSGGGEVPPHEATEVADALVKLIDAPHADLDDVLAFLPGPDFPGGGEVVDRAAIRRLYETGEATLRLRATIELALPARLVVSTPFPDAAPDTVAQLVSDAVRAGRLEGIARVQSAEGSFRVDLDRGGGRARLLAVKEALASLLPLEQDATYRLPGPLVPWLREFAGRLVREHGPRGARERILAARAAVPEGGRRTRIA